ncbi:hypothetical protein SLE2022_185660 [Rubroshorea leprosula]
MEYDYLFKLFVVGGGGVGKLGLIRRLKGNIFDEEKTLADILGLGFHVSMVNIEGKAIKLRIFSVGGLDRFSRCHSSCSKGLVGVLLVYDITRRETFNHIPTLMKLTGHPDHPNTTYMLVGNKCELENERAVSKEEAEQFAQQNGLLFVETSAATSLNVEEAFKRTANALKKIQDGLLIHAPSKDGDNIAIPFFILS